MAYVEVERSKLIAVINKFTIQPDVTPTQGLTELYNNISNKYPERTAELKRFRTAMNDFVNDHRTSANDLVLELTNALSNLLGYTVINEDTDLVLPTPFDKEQ